MLGCDIWVEREAEITKKIWVVGVAVVKEAEIEEAIWVVRY